MYFLCAKRKEPIKIYKIKNYFSLIDFINKIYKNLIVFNLRLEQDDFSEENNKFCFIFEYNKKSYKNVKSLLIITLNK